MVAADVEDAGGLDEGPDRFGLQVRDFVFVGGGQVRAHAAVGARDDDAAPARWVGRVDQVLGAHAGFGVLRAQKVGVFVGADAADVDD